MRRKRRRKRRRGRGRGRIMMSKMMTVSKRRGDEACWRQKLKRRRMRMNKGNKLRIPTNFVRVSDGD